MKEFQVRPYQQRLMGSVIDDWHGNNKYDSKVTSTLIESPPGSGKTVMGFSLAKTLKEQAREICGIDAKDLAVCWVAGRRNLLDQARKENDRLIGCDNVFYISQFSSSVPEDVFKFKKKLLVVDEAHHEACDSTHNIINSIDPDFMIGLSATPKRSDNAKLCFQKTYQDAGFYTLIDEGWLAKFDHWMIENWNPETVVNIYLEDPEKWGKSIMFFLLREQCETALRLLTEAGIKADLVTGQTDREAQIYSFESGEVDVLINMFVLTEGFDMPELKTVFVRDSGELPTIQMSGRVLRPHDNIPITNIVQSINTHWPFTRTANIAHKQYLRKENGWRYIGKSDLVEKVIRETILELSDAKVDQEMLGRIKAMSKSKKRKIYT